jgi:hypothetical protein
LLKFRDGSIVSKGGQPSTGKHSLAEIQEWQQSEQRRTAKHRISTHILTLRNGSRMSKKRQLSTGEVLTN